MELTTDRDVFFRGLQLLQNVVEPRQTLPILANVLLEAEKDTLRMTVTDLEVGARVEVPTRVMAPGSITISARKLAEIAKELPSEPVSITAHENSWVTLRCAGASFKLAGLPAQEYPVVEAAATTEWISLEARAVKEMLVGTSFAISHDDSRYALNGVLFAVRPKEIRMVATDGHRLALARRSFEGSEQECSGIVPKKAVHEIARVLGGGERVDLALTTNQFVLRLPNFLLTARLIEGQFPNYEQVLPKGHPTQLVLAREAVIAALRRVSLLADERTKPVRVVLSPGQLKFTAANPELGEAEESVVVEYSGETVSIGFNSRYLLDALSAIDGDQVVMELKDGTSPGVFKGLGSDEYVCVIMPMRI